MKNFELKYPVEGTSALQPKAVSAPAHRARIIEFPKETAHSVRFGQTRHAQTPVVSTLRGNAQGLPFERMQRWQAVVGGCVFAAIALGSLFVGL